ncbi:MAG: PLP-dependent aminotransferase family protein [Kiloniellales bacterium]|nr:PLP-dependent aminotransferase family protein [Kiloniellales bacterium]
MRDLIFPVDHHGDVSLQAQLRRHLVDAILDGRLAADEPLPSCRRLAQSLGVSRNTVVLAYQALADEGFLISRERIGYFVNTELVGRPVEAGQPLAEPAGGREAVDWWPRLRFRPSEQLQITKPKNWQRYPYPFIYGQADPSLFPTAAWRICSRQALGVQSIKSWADDSFDEDDPLLVEEVRTRVLPRRGIKAAPDEILITMGAQNALYLIAQLLAGPDFVLGVENPGYVDVRHIFTMAGARLKPITVDGEGLTVGRELERCDAVYVTPSHQSPTTVTLPLERRVSLLDQAARQDFFVIEDDYEAETNFVSKPTTALKSMDMAGNVIYVGSFSKHLAPGLRTGYLVASADLIRELRALRRMLLRHPPTNNQRTVALFIAGGYYDALVQRLQRTYHDRWEAMGAALARYLPDSATTPSFGGTSFWVRGPESLDSDVLARQALGEGIVIEPGSVFFHAPKPPRNYFRLGFSSIASERIAPGIEKLAGLIRDDR